MDDRIGLVFSWDPRSKTWMKERGPEDAAPPPAEPIDNEAVQTYFLDPQNGRWQATILGLKARVMAAELKDRYRSPFMPGLALKPSQTRTGLAALVEGAEEQRASRGSRAPLVVGLVLVVMLVGGGAFAAQAMLGGNSALATFMPSLPTAAAPATVAPAATATTIETAAAATAPTTAPAVAPTVAPTQAPAKTAAPTQAPARTAAPTVAPITTISYSTRLSNGTTVSYTGPSGVVQNTAWDGTFRALTSSGQAAFDNLTVYFGPIGNGHAVTVNADEAGTYRVSIRVTLPKGDQLLSVKFGNNGEIRTLGTISVR